MASTSERDKRVIAGTLKEREGQRIAALGVTRPELEIPIQKRRHANIQEDVTPGEEAGQARSAEILVPSPNMSVAVLTSDVLHG